MSRYLVRALIYQQKTYEHQCKDVQFGVSTMRDHCAAGRQDIRPTFAVKTRLALAEDEAGFVTNDDSRASGVDRKRVAQTIEQRAESGKLVLRKSFSDLQQSLVILIYRMCNVTGSFFGELSKLPAPVLGIAIRFDQAVPFKRGHQAGDGRTLDLQGIDNVLMGHWLTVARQQSDEHAESGERLN
jgi:hypothetical protein